jgi:hypothetical protein
MGGATRGILFLVVGVVLIVGRHALLTNLRGAQD